MEAAVVEQQQTKLCKLTELDLSVRNRSLTPRRRAAPVGGGGDVSMTCDKSTRRWRARRRSKNP